MKDVGSLTVEAAVFASEWLSWYMPGMDEARGPYS